MGCSWALYIWRGWLAKAAEERSRWWPMEFNGAAVLSIEFAPRGGGTEGQYYFRRGSGGGTTQDVEVALGTTVVGRTGGGGMASDRRRETKEERAEWAKKAGWVG
jgi:hypothetical protein